MKPWRYALALLWMMTLGFAASADHIPLQAAQVDLHDTASLQRGAVLFMQYCSGCHSLQYQRYERVKNDLHLQTSDSIFFKNAKPTDLIVSAMSPNDAAQWFGVAPPDLTLEARVKGADWIYTYLNGFYRDPARPLGTNNWIFPDTAMPNVLLNLQGEQIPHYAGESFQTAETTKITLKEIDHLILIAPGEASPQEFEQITRDITAFLTYSAEPIKLTRLRLGVWVVSFLALFLIIAYLLKREIWKQISSKR